MLNLQRIYNLIFLATFIAPFFVAWLGVRLYERRSKALVSYRKLKVFLIGLALLIIVPVAGLFISSQTPSNKQARQLMQQCKELHSGMTLEQVVGIMGSAYWHSTTTDPKIDFYEYSAPPIVSGPVGVRIQDGRVVNVLCGD